MARDHATTLGDRAITVATKAGMGRVVPRAARRLPAVARCNPHLAMGGTAGLVLASVVAAMASTGMRSSADATPARELAADVAVGTRDRILIGSDHSIRTALERASIAPGDIDRVVEEARRYVPDARLAPYTPIELGISPRPQGAAYKEIEALVIRPRLDTALQFRRVDGQLMASTVHMAIDATPMRITGYFGGDVRGTLAAYGITAKAIDDYVRIIGTQMALGDIARGDGFDVIVSRARASDGKVSTGGLIYAGLRQADGNRLRMSQWTLKGRLAWFDADKATSSIDNVQRPVPGEVSSNFGPRMHPILGYTRMHKGVDFRAGYGTPILAVQAGWVERAGWAGGYGNQVRLQHGGGIETSYSHMSAVATRPGALVRQGDVIGWVGATGLATGPHLHFEVMANGLQINPGLVAFTVGPQLRGSDLTGYRRRLDALLGVPVTRSTPET